jgi:uncharacterized protein (TIGR02996 family)
MNTENDFQDAIDAHPDDLDLRRVFADWLQEHNDQRADGYRALATQHSILCDYQAPPYRAYIYWVPDETAIVFPRDGSVGTKRCFSLAPDWYAALTANHAPSYVRYASRRDAENAAAQAFTLLPAERRHSLLTVREE